MKADNNPELQSIIAQINAFIKEQGPFTEVTDDVMQGKTITGGQLTQEQQDRWHMLIEALSNSFNAAGIDEETKEELTQELADLPNVAGKRTDQLDKALDKINTNWNRFINADPDGQLRFDVDTTRGRGKGKALVIFSLDFFSLGDNVKITKKLLPYDQRVYMAVDALYRAGNNFITLQQIYRTMGYDGQCGKADKEKIDKAMIKLKAAHITIDNTIEVEQAKYKYPHVVVDTQLLNAVRCRIIDNGQIVDGAYKILDEPVLMSFARGRNQVTRIDRQLLNVPKLNVTDTNILLEDYLIERIERAKNGNNNKTILLDTIYKYAGITEKKQKQRAPQKIIKILDYYKSINYINDYHFITDRIEIEI